MRDRQTDRQQMTDGRQMTDAATKTFKLDNLQSQLSQPGHLHTTTTIVSAQNANKGITHLSAKFVHF